MSDNLVMKTLLDIKEDVGGIKGDISILKEHHKEVADTLTRIESKHNQDYQQYVQSREELQKKVDPMWDDFVERKECKVENRRGFKQIFFASVQWIVITGMALLLGYHELKNK